MEIKGAEPWASVVRIRSTNLLGLPSIAVVVAVERESRHLSKQPRVISANLKTSGQQKHGKRFESAFAGNRRVATRPSLAHELGKLSQRHLHQCPMEIFLPPHPLVTKHGRLTRNCQLDRFTSSFEEVEWVKVNFCSGPGVRQPKRVCPDIDFQIDSRV